MRVSEEEVIQLGPGYPFSKEFPLNSRDILASLANNLSIHVMGCVVTLDLGLDSGANQSQQFGWFRPRYYDDELAT